MLIKTSVGMTILKELGACKEKDQSEIEEEELTRKRTHQRAILVDNGVSRHGSF